MDYPTVMWKFTVFSVKFYIPFLKDVYAFVLPFGGSGVLTGSHDKEKCTCDQLDNECVHMCACLFVDVEDYLGWYSFLIFRCWV